MSNNQPAQLSLAEFSRRDVIRDVNMLLDYPRNGKLLSRFSNLIAQNADLFKYWLLHYENILTINNLDVDDVSNGQKLMLAIIQLEAEIQPGQKPLAPFNIHARTSATIHSFFYYN